MKKISIDGNTAAATIAYAVSEVAAIYPITPSSNMAEACDEWAAEGKKNIFGQSMKIVEMQSEAGAAGAVHGSLSAGALTTTFTASQGLLLMIPNMYKIAGELLPTVFHVSARAIAGHALSIFGDHSDVMSCRGTGFCMLCSGSVQEVMDLALVSHIASLKSSLPFLHFFDGFRTSHEIQKIEGISQEDIQKIFPYDFAKKFKDRALDPRRPKQQGTAQNPDVFFQNKEASNPYYDKVFDIVADTMKEVEGITGRKYQPFDYIGNPNAKKVIVMMGSGGECVEDVLPEDTGLIKVRLYRPFNGKAFCDAIPATAKIMTVLDRIKEPGAIGDPLYADVMTALMENGKKIQVLAGRYGLGSKEFTPSCVMAILKNMSGEKKNHFTVGINDDVTFHSLPLEDYSGKSEAYELKFFGLGADGTVSANKNSIKIIGENTDKYVQAYFEYDSKKSGSLTSSNLRVSDKPIKQTYLVQQADFIAIHNFSFVSRFNLIASLKKGGVVLLNTVLNKETIQNALPKQFVDGLKAKNATLYLLDGNAIANEVGLGNKINVIMQTAFFKISNVIDFNIAVGDIKAAIVKTYGKKGDKVIENNMRAVDLSVSNIEKVDISTLGSSESNVNTVDEKQVIDKTFYHDIMQPIAKREGDDIPVSAFSPDGCISTTTSRNEKRGIAASIPKWIPENCIQCGRCVTVCPHAALRAVLTEEGNLTKKPKALTTVPALGVKGSEYCIQVSPYDCTGCGVCEKACIAKNCALEMVLTSEELPHRETCWNYTLKLPKTKSPFNAFSVKGSQFLDPYFEFSGACAGCGETPYIRLVTQFFGKNMIVANATGCSSIYGGSYPSCPYSVDKQGHGPAWANSLFEDNAEFGLGMRLAVKVKKAQLAQLAQEYLPAASAEAKPLIEKFVKDTNKLSNEETDALIAELKKDKKNKLAAACLEKSDAFAPKSVWIFGGDGWAYDIGYGGLDHILASGENVNILVLDTEVYSNTGGQASKSSPKGQVARFAAGGKTTPKKDLCLHAIAHKEVYVAKIAMGADYEQTIKAIKEAEAYDGPSLILAYAPCVAHGVDMSESQSEMKKAVETGYWELYRYNPLAEPKLTFDSKEPTGDYLEFLKGESRYSSLLKKDGERAMELFKIAAEEAKARREFIKKLV